MCQSNRREIELSGEFPELNDAVREIWERNADFWNERMGEGNDFHRVLIAPAQERLLQLRRGDAVLDIACGNGQFSRRMAELGAHVLAVDASARMIDKARSNTARHGEHIEFAVVDAMDRTALSALGRGRFDAAVCTMALMDIAAIEPLVSTLSTLLRPGGRFVFSVLHPCFNSAGVKLVAEEGTNDVGELVTRYSVAVFEYIRPRSTKGVAMRDQPAAQYFFERPLGVLFNSCFKGGFVLDGIEEPTFPVSASSGRPAWSNITQIPPALVVRMRLQTANV